MKFISAAFVILLFFSLLGDAEAGVVPSTGADFVAICEQSEIIESKIKLNKIPTEEEARDYGACASYQSAMQDSMIAVQQSYVMAGSKPTFCVPKGVNGRQLRAMLLKTLKDDPAIWHLPTPATFLFMLQNNFPCK